MKIVVGLGNPGPRYETTRHNAGFLAVDRLVERWKAIGPQRQYDAECYSAELGAVGKVLLIKPQSFMNRSGKSVAGAVSFFKCMPTDLLVIHDEADIAFGALRVKTGGGPGGHNGIRSIDESVGAASSGYHRLRIGVGKPDATSHVPLESYVLAPFSDPELRHLDEILDNVALCTEMILAGRLEEAQNRFHRKPSQSEGT